MTGSNAPALRDNHPQPWGPPQGDARLLVFVYPVEVGDGAFYVAIPGCTPNAFLAMVSDSVYNLTLEPRYPEAGASVECQIEGYVQALGDTPTEAIQRALEALDGCGQPT